MTTADRILGDTINGIFEDALLAAILRSPERAMDGSVEGWLYQRQTKGEPQVIVDTDSGTAIARDADGAATVCVPGRPALAAMRAIVQLELGNYDK